MLSVTSQKKNRKTLARHVNAGRQAKPKTGRNNGERQNAKIYHQRDAKKSRIARADRESMHDHGVDGPRGRNITLRCGPGKERKERTGKGSLVSLVKPTLTDPDTGERSRGERKTRTPAQVSVRNLQGDRTHKISLFPADTLHPIRKGGCMENTCNAARSTDQKTRRKDWGT